VLSLATFEFELYNNTDGDLKIAKKSFNNAITALDTVDLDEEWYSQACMILQLIRDKINLWDLQLLKRRNNRKEPRITTSLHISSSQPTRSHVPIEEQSMV
jgi:hypothetical protein